VARVFGKFVTNYWQFLSADLYQLDIAIVSQPNQLSPMMFEALQMGSNKRL
jgi:hypothetical protein